MESPAKKTFKHQIGTDISSLVKNLIDPNLSSEIIFSPDYILTFKSIQNNRAFRAGIGGEINRIVSDDNRDDKVTQNSLRLRMGFEKQKVISDRWLYTMGMDVKFSTSRVKDESGSSFDADSNSKSFGLAPLLGIQFKLTPHLYLQTEASFNLFYGTSTQPNFDFIIFPGPEPFNEDKKIKSFGGYISIPNIIHLVVEF